MRFADACRAVGRRGDPRRVDLRADLAVRGEARLIDFRFVAMKSSRLGKRAKLIPQVEVSTQRREGHGKPVGALFLTPARARRARLLRLSRR